MVTRGDPDVDELVFSAKGICSNKRPTKSGDILDDPVKQMLEPFFRPLAKAYLEICAKQQSPFFGLRDFYRLNFVNIFMQLYVNVNGNTV